VTRSGANVTPVSAPDISKEFFTPFEQLREHAVLEHKRLAFGDVFQYSRFENVDARVDCVAGYFFGFWFFQKPANPTVLLRFYQTISSRIGNWCEYDRRSSLSVSMKADDLVEIDIGEHIAVKDDRRFVDEASGVTIRSGGTERRCLDGVTDSYVVVGAIPEFVL